MLIKDYDQIYILCVDKRWDEVIRIRKLLEDRGGKVRTMLNGFGQILPEELYDQINYYAIPSKFGGNLYQYFNLKNTKNIFHDAIKKGYKSILIVEDDLILTDNFDEILGEVTKELPHNWDMLYYGFNRDIYPYDTISEHLIKVRAGFTTHMFGVKNTLFQTFVDLPETCGTDVLIHNLILAKHNCYAIDPDIAVQRPGVSTIWGSYQDYTTYFKHTGKPVYD